MMNFKFLFLLQVMKGEPTMPILKIVDISKVKPNSYYDCITFDINSEYFNYNPELKIVTENFNKLIENHIDFEYYTISVSDKNSKLIRDMNKTNLIKFMFSKKLIGASSFIEAYIDFEKKIKIMTLDDYLHLDNPLIMKKYNSKFIAIYDELPHLYNFDYIPDLLGYEINCVHLNADSEYFEYDSSNHELFERSIMDNLRRQINNYILDVSIDEFDDDLKLEHGDKFKGVMYY